MEDSFRVRLDRAFGSLNPCSSTPASSSLTSLWCLTDEEIERRNSKKSKADLDHTDAKTDVSEKDLVSADIEDLNDFVDEDELNDSDDDDDDKAGKSLVKPDDHNEEEWDIRSSIGLDCTLDYEEEEDEYDKVAVGKESKTEDEEEEKRLYLKDKHDYEVDMDYHDELPDTFKENIQRDPRANHTAAKLRLKEDAESSGYFDSLQSPIPTPALNLKSILKRKENQSQNRSDKRVRFHLHHDDDDIKEELETTTITPVESSDSRVPDYVRNPSRYTHYTFDDSVSEMDEESNKKAHLEFLNQLRTTTTTMIDPPLPKSVIFSSRKKQKESQSSEDEECRSKESSCKRNRVAIGIAAKGLQESEISHDGVCAMEEDEPETVGVGVSNLKRQARKYRAKEIVE